MKSTSDKDSPAGSSAVRQEPITSAGQPAASPDTKPQEKPGPDRMVLTTEAGLHRKGPPWTLVEQVVRELDSGRGNSFCCLALAEAAYIQTLHGFNGYHLEWRVGGDPENYLHLRASYPGASEKEMELKKSDHVSAGEHRDLIQLDDVVEAFRIFHQNGDPPGWMEWRELDV